MSRIRIGLLGFCSALLGVSAHAQGVVNPLYGLGHEKCVAQDIDVAQVSSAERPEGEKSRFLPPTEIFLYLYKRYPITPTSAAELSYSQKDLLIHRLVDNPKCKADPKACKSKQNDPGKQAENKVVKEAAGTRLEPRRNPLDTGVRFKDDSNALLFRRSLLRYFEAAYSGGANSFRVLVDEKSVLDIVEQSDRFVYRPMQSIERDDKLIKAFIEQVLGGEMRQPNALDVNRSKEKKSDPFSGMLFQTLCLQYPEPASGQKKRTLVRLEEPKVKTSSDSEEKRYKLNQARLDKRSTDIIQKVTFSGNEKFLGGTFRLLKDAAQFTASKPEESKLSSTFNQELAENQSDVAIDAALGVTFGGGEFAIRPVGWKDGSKLYWTPFLSIDQETIKVKQFDPEEPLTNGQARIVDRGMAYADIAAGLRFDLLSDAETGPDGIAEPKARLSVTAAAITDNYSDQQAVQLELSLLPKSFNTLPAFRKPVRLGRDPYVEGGRDRTLSTATLLTSGFFEWDVTFVADYLDYARTPRDFDTPEPGDRKNEDEANAFRVGGDIGAKFSWGNIFSPSSDPSRLELGIDYKYREGLDKGDGTAGNFSTSLALRDIIDERYSIALSYDEGDTLLSQQEFESIKLEVGMKFGAE